MFTLPTSPKYWVYAERGSGSELLAAFKSLEDAKHYVAGKPFECSIWKGLGDNIPAEKIPVISH